jgi:hypothetical protein
MHIQNGRPELENTTRFRDLTTQRELSHMNKLITNAVCALVAFFAFACGSAIKPVVSQDTQNASKILATDVGGITVFHKAPKASVAKQAPIFHEEIIDKKDTSIDCSVDVVRPGTDEVIETFATLPEAHAFARQEFTSVTYDETSVSIGYEANLYRDPACNKVSLQELAIADSE